MDRFIADDLKKIQNNCKGLKSNMDRFIECSYREIYHNIPCLKSNMDRFIASAKRPFICSKKLFKIQYG